MNQRDAGGDKHANAGAVLGDGKPENILEIRQAVTPTEAHLIAGKREHQRVGQRLGDDGDIHAGYFRAERQPAGQTGQCARPAPAAP